MVENLIELGVNLIEALIIVDFLTKFFGHRENNSATRWGFYGILIIFFLEISLMNFLTPFEGVAVVIYILTLALYCQKFLKGKTAVKLLMCTFVIAIVHLISISTILLISYFRDLNTLDLINILSTERIMLIITTKLLLFYITRLILKLKINANLSIIEGMLLLGMPLASIVSMSFMMSTALLHSDIKIEVILSMLSVLFTNILVYFLFMKISNDNEEKLKNELIAQNYEDERKNAENIKAMSNKMLGLKHDLKNHFTTLKLYLEEEKYQEAERYIDNLIKEKLEGIIPLVRTGNNALNAILNSKLATCKTEGIYFEINVVKDAVEFMEDDDVCILFGNILDNAIEAAKSSDEKIIRLKIQKQGAYASIFVTNSIKKSVLKTNSTLESTKQNKELHGYGIKNIILVVSRYKGMIDFFEKDDEFCCDILLLY